MGVTLQGFVDPQGEGGGQVDFSFNVGLAQDSFLGSWNINSDPDFPGGFPFRFVSATKSGPLFYSGIHDLTADFVVGTPFRISERLSVGTFKLGCQSGVAACNASAAGSVNIDFGHSSYWNGISAITVQDSVNEPFNPVDLNLFNVSSASNKNFFQSFVPQTPVPVPAACWLLVSALVGAGGWMRRTATETRSSHTWKSAHLKISVRF